MVAQKVTHGELDQKEYHRHFFRERVVSLDGTGLRCVLYQAHGDGVSWYWWGVCIFNGNDIEIFHSENNL